MKEVACFDSPRTTKHLQPNGPLWSANKKLITGYSIYRPGGLPTSAVWSMEWMAGSVGHRQ